MKNFMKEKKTNPIVVILIVIGVITVIAAAAYAIYRFFAPDYLEDFEDEDIILEDITENSTEDAIFEE